MTSNSQNEAKWLLRALELAEARRGYCAPNPAVGAVVVKNEQIIGEGTHWACGHPHAEVMALQAAGEVARGASLYVTLEPCAHTGHTPPCIEAIKASGINTVFYAMNDANPNVSGGGAALLNQAGIHCQKIQNADIEAFYQSYFFWLAHRRPWVTAKLALSLDGKIAGAKGVPIQITGKEAQIFTHQQRRRSDAILTSVATIIADDPQLNVRLENTAEFKPLYILDSQLRLPLSAKILKSDKPITLFYDEACNSTKLDELQKAKVKCLPVKKFTNGLDLCKILSLMGQEGVHDLWIEAGGKLFFSFIEKNLVQTAYLLVAPKLLGENATSCYTNAFSFLTSFSVIKWSNLGNDAMAKIML